MTVQETLNLGVQYHQAGKLGEAEAAYRQILAVNPQQPDALNLLGALAGQVGKYEQAMDLIRRASTIEPNRAEFHANMGIVHAAQGQRAQAAQCFLRAVHLEPRRGEYYFRLGSVHLEMGNYDNSLACFELAASLDNGQPAAHNAMGITHRYKGNLDAAIGWYGQALALQPEFAEAANNLAEALIAKGESGRAIEAARHALKVKPDFTQALNNLGNALRLAGRPDEAVATYQKVAKLDPKLAQTYQNMGNAYSEMGDFARAEGMHRRAIEITPDYVDAHLSLGVIHLRRGELERGWGLFDWRLKLPGMGLRAGLPGTVWTGGEFGGKRILLVAEQGLGDTIQFVRYAAMVAQRGATVILSCAKELAGLLRGAEGVSDVVASDGALPAADAHCALLSLPGIFRTGMNNIPAKLSYLSADPALKEKWAARIPAGSNLPRVGLVWAGGGRHPANRERSFDLWGLGALAKAREGAKFFSLQVAETSFQAIAPPKGMDLTDLGKEVTDFSDTAAIIANLDLVITADTAVAHLAGALGKPVWVLLPFVADWRWFTDRDDSPWYPTMRLFRQEKAGDWEAPVRKAAEALGGF